MFSDGIRPGGDLTELDGSPESRRPPRRTSSRGNKKSRHHHHGPVAASDVAKSLIPAEGLPYVSGQGPVETEELTKKFLTQESIPFSLNRNLRVYVKLVHCRFSRLFFL
jgi:MAD (mothers against decapentaplegic) interacting protein